MKNMTQNIQNGSFDIKRGSRILRIISARVFLPFHPTRGVGHMEGHKLYAKNVIDVF